MLLKSNGLILREQPHQVILNDSVGIGRTAIPLHINESIDIQRISKGPGVPVLPKYGAGTFGLDGRNCHANVVRKTAVLIQFFLENISPKIYSFVLVLCVLEQPGNPLVY